MKLQFHVHTRFSRDSYLPLFLLRLMCQARGVECVCITDHNEIDGAVRCKEKYESGSFHVIVGEEIFTDRGEIIGLFLRERIPPKLSVGETIRSIRAQGGLVIVPHPYEVERAGTVLAETAIAEYRDEIDAMESENGRNFRAEYGAAQEKLCEKYGLVKILGSDAHTVWEIGANTMEVRDMPTVRNFPELLRDARFSQRHMPRVVHWITKLHKGIGLFTGHYRRKRT